VGERATSRHSGRLKVFRFLSHGGLPVATAEFLTHLFCLVDDRLGARPKHPQAKLWPSEIVTLGLLCALKGGSFRSF
jgi:hypothetical protein